MSNAALSAAATGMIGQTQNVGIIANDIANMNTMGYKASRAIFSDLMYVDSGGVGANSSASGTVNPTGIQIGLGTKLVGVTKDMGQGEMQMTESPLDISIQGGGFFQITLPDGSTGYTRAGSFQKSPDGELVTIQGFKLASGIVIPGNAEQIAINAEGGVFARLAGQQDPQSIGTIELASFLNPNGLQSMGDNLYKETKASGSASTGLPGANGLGALLQGSIERSNVSPVVGMTNLIEAQRAYELNAKVIKAADEMERETSNIVR